MIATHAIRTSPEVFQLIASINAFKGAWRALGTQERIGSSTRIEGSKLSDREVELLLREKIGLTARPELSLRIVEFAREHGRITMGDAIRLTDGKRNPLKQHFRVLVERGHRAQHGAGHISLCTTPPKRGPPGEEGFGSVHGIQKEFTSKNHSHSSLKTVRQTFSTNHLYHHESEK
ncbi:hypothetical protein [Verminephrobacter aporrectodeae]|uniref:hypothetical protein n=1 Tax=Verminephrobacter aporrectodeae TaxID=1110389 RepID=UPI002243B63A|nr:hypothetical protein [Verminephrobacter aporrectodeae]